MAQVLPLVPRGSFSLRAAAGFGFGPNEGRPPAFDGTMRLAFGLDGGEGYAGATLRQPDGADGPVEIELELRGVRGDDALAAARAQTARIVSLDHDGAAFAAVGRRERVIGPFYPSLIVLRASGFADAWVPMPSHRGVDHVARYCGIEGELDPEHLAALAESWRPFRTWSLVLIRLAGDRGTRL